MFLSLVCVFFLFIITQHCMYLYWTASVFDIDYGKCWRCSTESSFLGDLIFDGVKQIILEDIYIYIYREREREREGEREPRRKQSFEMQIHFRYNGQKFLSQMLKVDIWNMRRIQFYKEPGELTRRSNKYKSLELRMTLVCWRNEQDPSMVKEKILSSSWRGARKCRIY